MAVDVEAAAPRPRPAHRRPKTEIGPLSLWSARIAIVALVLAAWQWLPKVGFVTDRLTFVDPFFISSPRAIATEIGDLVRGAHGATSLWPYLWQTMKATLIGVAAGTISGALVGLVLSSAPRAEKVLRPFITMLNASPRIALVPIFIIIAGPTLLASVLVCVAVVFFIVFYNALAGGRAVPAQTLQNARLLGATQAESIRVIRLPYVAVWTFAALPNAISFGLISVVTAEILTGAGGMGRLLSLSIQTTDATLTFAVVVILMVVGVVLIAGTEWLQRRVLHWWSPTG
jgi:NitT/TauT family transport system permease protein